MRAATLRLTIIIIKLCTRNMLHEFLQGAERKKFRSLFQLRAVLINFQVLTNYSNVLQIHCNLFALIFLFLLLARIRH